MKRYDSARARRAGLFLAAIFATLALAIAAGAYVSHALARHSFLLAKGDELRAIADLKVSQIVAWRAERLANARVVAGDPLLVAATREWLAAGGRAERGAALSAHLGSLRKEYGYERVSLLDADGALRLSAPGPGRVQTEELARQARASPEVSFLDLHRPDTGEGIHLELVAPLRLPGDPGARAVAFLEFLIDPQRFLYPLVQSWPTPSRSGEVLLIRREGDAVVYLNELRHRKGTALVLRLPVSQPDLPSALALQGKEGVVEGRDYRGQRVLAALRRVPDSPWFLVSKVDHQEVVAPLARDAWLIALLALALIAVAGLGAQRVWRRQRDVSDAELRENEERYRLLFEGMPNGVAYCRMLFDQGHPQDFVYLEVNPVFESLTGLRDVVGKKVTEVIPGIRETNPELFEIYGRVARTGNPETFEAYVAALKVWFSVSVYSSKPEHFVAVFDVITERKHTEAALQSGEARYRVLFEQSPDGVLLVDAETGKTIEANEAASKQLGYTREEFAALGVFDYEAKEAREETRRRMQKVLSEGSDDFETLHRAKNGEIRNVHVWVRTVSFDGRTAFYALFQDVTERKQAEQALRESEERQRRIFETVPVSIWREDWSKVIAAVRDLKARGVEDFAAYIKEHPEFVTEALRKVRILDVNQRTLEMFGARTKEEMLASLETVFATEDTLPGFAGELAALGAGRLDYEAEMALRTVHGDLIHVLLTMLFPEEGAEAGDVLVSLMDITDRKRAEEALRESEERQRLAVEAAQLGIWSWEVPTDTITWSPRCGKLFGLDQDERMSYAIFRGALHPEDRERTDQAVQRALEQRTEYRIEYRALWRDGSVHWLAALGRGFYDEAGSVERMMGVLLDIDDRIRAEHALRARTQELARSNAELERFAYVASHDLQEPLRTVASYVQLLERRYKDKLDADAKEFIGYAVDASKRMQRLINDLLDYSRITTRGRAIAPTGAEAALGQALVNVQALIEEGAALVTHDPLPVVLADDGQLVQLFQNLLANALRFRRVDAPPRVHVSASPSDGQWDFSIRDNGIGIAPEYFERIFVVFQRLHGPEAYPGTGIGLAICKKIVERHGGRIWVESQPGEGSTFFFTLPGVEEHPA